MGAGPECVGDGVELGALAAGVVPAAVACHVVADTAALPWPPAEQAASPPVTHAITTTATVTLIGVLIG